MVHTTELQAGDFQAMTASVLPSQQTGVELSRQAVLASHGDEVRAALSQLPAATAAALTQSYSEPMPALLDGIGAGIEQHAARGSGHDHGHSVDTAWLNASQPGADLTTSPDDDWNRPA